MVCRVFRVIVRGIGCEFSVRLVRVVSVSSSVLVSRF